MSRRPPGYFTPRPCSECKHEFTPKRKNQATCGKRYCSRRRLARQREASAQRVTRGIRRYNRTEERQQTGEWVHPFVAAADRAEARLRSCAAPEQWPSELEKIRVELTRTHDARFAAIVHFALVERLGNAARSVPRQCRRKHCDRQAHCRGLCMSHYARLHRAELKRAHRQAAQHAAERRV